MVRHHLTDDWAFANETEKRPWEYRGCENDLKKQCQKFNKICSNDDVDWKPIAHVCDEAGVTLITICILN